MNKLFGPEWAGTPAGEDLELVPTPVGESCLWCEEPITEGESGIIQPFLAEPGWRWASTHRECHLRHLFGSVAHQTGPSCSATACADDPALTRREAALAAVRFFEARGLR